MENIDLTGKWKGTIIFGSAYKRFNGEKLYFIAEFKQLNENFSGESEDVGGFGVNSSKAIINGHFKDNNIFFKKQYKKAGLVNTQTGEHSTLDEPSKIINYQGSFDFEANEIKGQWTYEGSNCSGTWTMQRMI